VYWWGVKEHAFFFVMARSCENTSAVRDWSGHSKDSYVCYGGEGSCWPLHWLGMCLLMQVHFSCLL